MRIQYQGVDVQKNVFKVFDLLDGIYDLEYDHNRMPFIWTTQRFQATLSNIQTVNIRVQSPIDNIIYINGLKFTLLPNVITNITITELQQASKLLAFIEKTFLPDNINDSRQLGVIIHMITVDGTNIF